MIVVNLFGGLGNQMFQFACGLVLSKATGCEVRYRIDGLGRAATARRFELNHVFGLSPTLASESDLRGIIGRWRSPLIMRRILSRQNFRLLRGKQFITDPKLSFVPDLLQRASTGAYLHGYWQSAQYFDEYEDSVRSAFSFKNQPDLVNRNIMARMLNEPSIGVHVRRGDYLSNPKANSAHGILPINYYVRSIEELLARNPGAKIYVFSDDPDWAKESLANEFRNTECITHNSGVDSFRDMQLLAQCESLVIANSSFSWWAAWLNERKGKTVIAPKEWFKDPHLDSTSILPAQWLAR